MYTELEIDNSCDFDDGGGDKPLIQELDLDDVVSQVPPELVEQEHPTLPESASPEPALNLQEETAEIVFNIGNNFSIINSLLTGINIIGQSRPQADRIPQEGMWM